MSLCTVDWHWLCCCSQCLLVLWAVKISGVDLLLWLGVKQKPWILLAAVRKNPITTSHVTLKINLPSSLWLVSTATFGIVGTVQPPPPPTINRTINICNKEWTRLIQIIPASLGLLVTVVHAWFKHDCCGCNALDLCFINYKYLSSRGDVSYVRMEYLRWLEVFLLSRPKPLSPPEMTSVWLDNLCWPLIQWAEHTSLKTSDSGHGWSGAHQSSPCYHLLYTAVRTCNNPADQVGQLSWTTAWWQCVQ